MANLTKEQIELIDMMCECPPVEFDNSPFDTFEKRLKEDDHIAEVAQCITGFMTGELLDDCLAMLHNHYSLIMSIIQVLTSMNKEIEQCRNQCTNLEKRVFALEQRYSKKKAYKTYTE